MNRIQTGWNARCDASACAWPSSVGTANTTQRVHKHMKRAMLVTAGQKHRMQAHGDLRTTVHNRKTQKSVQQGTGAGQPRMQCAHSAHSTPQSHTVHGQEWIGGSAHRAGTGMRSTGPTWYTRAHDQNSKTGFGNPLHVPAPFIAMLVLTWARAVKAC